MTPDDYRKQADECRNLASSAATAEERQQILVMAETWEELAESREQSCARRTDDRVKEIGSCGGSRGLLLDKSRTESANSGGAFNSPISSRKPAMPYELTWTATDGSELYEFYQSANLAFPRAMKLIQEGRGPTLRDKSTGVTHGGETILEFCKTIESRKMKAKP